MNISIEESWKKVLNSELEKDYFKKMTSFLQQKKEKGQVIYPPDALIFNAFELTPFDKVKWLF